MMKSIENLHLEIIYSIGYIILGHYILSVIFPYIKQRLEVFSTQKKILSRMEQEIVETEAETAALLLELQMLQRKNIVKPSSEKENSGKIAPLVPLSFEIKSQTNNQQQKINLQETNKKLLQKVKEKKQVIQVPKLNPWRHVNQPPHQPQLSSRQQLVHDQDAAFAASEEADRLRLRMKTLQQMRIAYASLVPQEPSSTINENAINISFRVQLTNGGDTTRINRRFYLSNMTDQVLAYVRSLEMIPLGDIHKLLVTQGYPSKTLTTGSTLSEAIGNEKSVVILVRVNDE
jgi:hypothetical protein